MKTPSIKHTLILPLGLCMTIVACHSPEHPWAQWKSNPYQDDYAHKTSIHNKDQWGVANVHDPCVIKADSIYYAFSTDAYYVAPGVDFNPDSVKIGHIQIRQSKDLINWTFAGWVFDQVPAEAVEHVHSLSNGKGADGVWAPYVVKHNNEFRLYYSVSGFGTNSSFIGMATATSPLGPWSDKGCVVKTTPESVMNAIDPTIVSDAQNGKMWMIYGSYFGGIFCVELNPSSGFTQTPDDQGHLVATRGNKEHQIIEAPEIIYNPQLKQYFLFVSYDPLFTHYNVRVGRSDKPEGPYYDFFGNNMADTTNNYPILTHSYKFSNHPGWSGNAHCSVINDNGRYYMFHQGRLAPDNLMMIMQTREIKWLPSGWPVVSPERFAGNDDTTISNHDLVGDWEIITLNEIPDQVKLWQGQIPPGGWTYADKEYNLSHHLKILDNGQLSGIFTGQWTFSGNVLNFNNTDCIVFFGWDWENQSETILFSGLLKNGTTIWGKKVNLTNKI